MYVQSPDIPLPPLMLLRPTAGRKTRCSSYKISTGQANALLLFVCLLLVLLLLSNQINFALRVLGSFLFEKRAISNSFDKVLTRSIWITKHTTQQHLFGCIQYPRCYSYRSPSWSLYKQLVSTHLVFIAIIGVVLTSSPIKALSSHLSILVSEVILINRFTTDFWFID